MSKTIIPIKIVIKRENVPKIINLKQFCVLKGELDAPDLPPDADRITFFAIFLLEILCMKIFPGPVSVQLCSMRVLAWREEFIGWSGFASILQESEKAMRWSRSTFNASPTARDFSMSIPPA
mmetsp:Transcript_29889/g.39290  ORF Transcript_29889/g.39290 Transcript_29889/m.39290 type:complete len:122 (+) Transcript_29889:83-448(+)